MNRSTKKTEYYIKLPLTINQLKELFPKGAYLDRKRENLIANCPKCGYMEFGISIKGSHLFGCYRLKKCGYRGNIYTLLKFLDRRDFYISLPGEDINKKIENKLRLILEEESELELDLPNCNLPIGWKRVYRHSYLDSRGFDQYDRYKVGITTVDPRFKNYVIFAIEECGNIKGYIARNVRKKEEIDTLNKTYKEKGASLIRRYLNSDTNFGKLAFGIDEVIQGVTKTLILVEGIFDKFNVDKLLELHSDDSLKCNCTFKCACSIEQIYKWLFLGIERVILLYDPDVLSQIKKTAFELEKYFEVFIGFNKNGNDPGDMTLDELEVVLNDLKSPIQFYIDRIQIKNWTFGS